VAKAEISWKRETPEGRRVQVYAHHVGNRWKFYWRERRYEQWQPLEQPPLEDWLELLDAVERRIARRLQRPEESARIRRAIAERFPEAEINP
jgi:hypothetical protein